MVLAAGLLCVPGVAQASSFETTVTPVAGHVPVSLDSSSCVAIAEALAQGTVSVEGTLPVVVEGLGDVQGVAFDALLVLSGAVLGSGAFYLFVRAWRSE